MIVDFAARARRALRKPPRVVAVRLAQELRAEADRFVSPWSARRTTEGKLLSEFRARSIDELWTALAERPFFAALPNVTRDEYDRFCPDDGLRVARLAENAANHRIDLLGSGLIELGEQIDWHKDYKTGKQWDCAYFRDIDYCNPELPSDVKVPWEISRMQWLIPAAQEYRITGDERHAECVRNVLVDWINANPYAHGVNWACTMEVALRILSWTYFFRVFHSSPAWTDRLFRTQFLTNLYLHGKFTASHLECSDINGNHYTADAAGLVFAGLFFGKNAACARWAQQGWQILCDELPKQVYADGVDFEGSVPYHRLVFELFLFPALYRTAAGFVLEESYRERLLAMARFSAAYSRPNGTVPLWGDADDARALPFGGQAINDHRYISGLAGVALNDTDLQSAFSGPAAEIFWILGEKACEFLQSSNQRESIQRSTSFPEAGFYVMRNEVDHVFIDCGPVGTGGRGGHGHNDCLSFEAVLDGVNLISDSGAYVYTASYTERNHFRSTGYHNTPQVDGEEINRFVRPANLWTLEFDAVPEIRAWVTGAEEDKFSGAHKGYRRLKSPVTPVRTISLNHARHCLTIRDSFEGDGEHLVEIPLHLASGVEAGEVSSNSLALVAGHRRFSMTWSDSELWNVRIQPSRVSPSYGIINKAQRVIWSRKGSLSDLVVSIAPQV